MTRPLLLPLLLALLLVPLVLVAGCNKAPSAGGEPDGPVASGGPAVTNLTNLPPAEKAATLGGLPPAAEPTRFVGLWAKDEGSCDTAPWRFTVSSLKTPDGASCSLDRATKLPEGYSISAVCSAGAVSKPDRITIRFDEAAKAMQLKSKTLGTKQLVFCGRET